MRLVSVREAKARLSSCLDDSQREGVLVTNHGKPKSVVIGIDGYDLEDVVRMLFYRPELAGKHLRASLQEAMRGPSEWSVGERELMAAFVSQKNQCPF